MNKELLNYLIEEYETGKCRWMRTALELRFSEPVVEAAINEGHLVYNNAGEILLAFQVEGTLSNILYKESLSQDALAVLQALNGFGTLPENLRILQAFSA